MRSSDGFWVFGPFWGGGGLTHINSTNSILAAIFLPFIHARALMKLRCHVIMCFLGTANA